MRVPSLLAILTITSAADCDCLLSWTHNSGSGNETYEGCQTTKDGKGYPWCKVLDNCTAALQGVDSVSTPFKYINCWEGTNPLQTCECSNNCTDDVTSPYCTVMNPPCASAPEPVPGKSAYMTCEPDVCKCKDNWTFNNKAYQGCSTTPEGNSPNIPWCEVDILCKHAHPANGSLPRFRYCDDFGTLGNPTCECKPNTCQNTAFPRCEVTTPCHGAPDSSTGIGFMACSPIECACDATWEHNGTTYSGCSITPDSPHQAWCQAGAACLSQQLFASSNNKKWVQCTDPNSCDCLDSWDHNGETFKGCQTTSDFPSTPWCKVTAACSKSAAQYEGGSSILYHWITCNSGTNPNQKCECTGPCNNVQSAYCTVNKACTTVPAPVAPQTVGYATCVPTECECKSMWSFNDQTYHGCAATSGNGYWCVVSGGDTCKGSLPINTTDQTAGNWRACETPPPPPSNCTCLDSWDYKGKNYTGCRTTSDSPGSPWCKVNPDCKDLNIDKTVGYKWSLCYEGLDYNKTCECKPNACVDVETGSPYCAVSNAPCATTPIADPNNEAYATCTPEACKCLKSWQYNNKQYSGCVTTEGSPGTSWCAVSPTCKNANSKSNPGLTTRYCKDGIDYSKTCSCGSNTCVNTAQPYCQVVNAPCDVCPPAGQQGAFISCIPEECKKCNSAGCQLNTTDPFGYVSNWCKLDDNAGCLSAGDANGTKWAYCEPKIACDCKQSWTYKGKQYSGCSSTPDHTSDWCMVSSNCFDSSFGSDGDTTFSWVSCGDGIVPTPTIAPTPENCSCLSSWENNGITYTGCRTTPDSPGQPWCKINNTCSSISVDTTVGYKWSICSVGIDKDKLCECKPNTCVDTDSGSPYCSISNAPCATSPVADPNNEAYAQCLPEACKCLDTWTYKSKTYAGCVTTQSSPGIAWCAVSEKCKSSDSKTNPGMNTRLCNVGIDYTKTCSCGTNMCSNTDIPYCQVVNSPCNVSPPAGTQGAFTGCAPAECKKCAASWTYNNQTHQGCAMGITDPLKLSPSNWCILQDESCLSAGEVNGQKWAYCEPQGACDCLQQWTHKGVSYKGCSSTPDSSGEWCEVSSACLKSSYGSNGSSWLSCGASLTPGGPCSCLASWEYKGKQYAGCKTTMDSPGKPWCRVHDSCKDVDVDTNYGWKWMSCYDGIDNSKPCECQPGTCTDVDSSTGMEPYCVASNTPCATSPSPNAQNKAYMQCTPDVCKCLESWTHKEKQYSGCVTTEDSPSAAWCIVSPDCKSANKQNPSLPKRYCQDGFDQTKVCSCGSNVCANSFAPFCLAVNAPCSTAPAAVTGAFITCIPDECRKCASSWTSGGETYSNCATGLTDPSDIPNSNWCILDDNAGCLSAGDVNGKKWAYCEPSPTSCDCLPSWSYKGNAYSGCAATPDHPDTQWCVVSNNCLSAQYGSSDDKVFSWKSCGTSNGPPKEDNEDGGLSVGIIIVIVVASIVVVAVAVAAVCYSLKMKRSTPENIEVMHEFIEEPHANYVCIPQVD